MTFSATSQDTPEARYEITLVPAQMEPITPPITANTTPPSNIPTLLIGVSLITAVLIFTGTLRLGSR